MKTKTTSASVSYGGSFSWGSYSRFNEKRYDREGLNEMLHYIRAYDEGFMKLARAGGGAEDIYQLTSTLNAAFTVYGPRGDEEARLSNPASVSHALSRTGQYDIHFEVRRGELGFPLYYLCRIHQDPWSRYGLIVEDVYRSGRFEFDEPRFVKLLRYGRNRLFLRLSEYRALVARMLGETGPGEQPETDELLFLIGKDILQGAWHVDQRFSFMVADALDLPNLKQAVELSYLCLSCDLCAMRRHVSNDLLRFFDEIYPNQSLAKLVSLLPEMTGNQFNALAQKALGSYIEIAQCFNDFLKTQLEWKTVERGEKPLWKLLLANTNRLNLVANQMHSQEGLAEARRKLERESRKHIEELLRIAGKSEN